MMIDMEADGVWRGFTLNRKEPVYLQLTMRVKRLILVGELQNGSRLPSRRETAAQMEINPNTVQKAYKLMEEEGYLVTDGNLGSVVRCPEEIRGKIGAELKRDLASKFVADAKAIHLSFKQTVDLLSELWDEPD